MGPLKPGVTIGYATTLVFAGCIASDVWAFSINRQADSLIGRWIWHDERPDLVADATIAARQSFLRLEFLKNGQLEGFQYFANAFERGGEALESGYGRYRLRKSRLIIMLPRKTEITGWPSRDGVYYQAYRCGFRFDATKASFSLTNCPLSGPWVRATTDPR